MNPSAPGNPDSRGDTPPLSPSFTTVDLAIDSVTNAFAAPGKPVDITGTLYEGGKLPDVALVGTAIGDFNVLSGKTLYVIVEDPAKLFLPGAQAVPITSPKPGLLLPLYGAPLLTPGAFTGSLRIYVCLDAQCTIRLGNVPYSIPYHVVVKRDLKVEIDKAYEQAGGPFPKETMHVVSAVSQTLPVLTARITPPEGRSVASLKASLEDVGLPNVRPVPTITDNGDGTATLSISVPTPFTRPGNYSANIIVGSDIARPAPDDPAYLEARTKRVIVTYDVRPLVENAPVTFSPPRLELTLSASEQSPAVSAGPMGARSVSFTYGGVPADSLRFSAIIEWQEPFPQLVPADNLPKPFYSYVTGGDKFYFGADYLDAVTYRRCANASQPYCLPVGTHSFRLGYTYVRPDGVQATGYYPGQITVTP